MIVWYMIWYMDIYGMIWSDTILHVPIFKRGIGRVWTRSYQHYWVCFNFCGRLKGEWIIIRNGWIPGRFFWLAIGSDGGIGNASAASVPQSHQRKLVFWHPKIYNNINVFSWDPKYIYTYICIYIYIYMYIPIGSMYGIYANIWSIWMANVTIYSIHGSYGIYTYI